MSGGSPSEQLAELKRFLWNIVDELNHLEESGTESTGKTETAVDSTTDTEAGDVIRTATLKASAWTGTASPYSQQLGIGSIPGNRKVELLPSKQVLADLFNAGTALTTENNGGTVTVYALGKKPTKDISMQVAISKAKTGG
jgi:hypothetical protein